MFRVLMLIIAFLTTACGTRDLDLMIESLKPADVQCVIWQYDQHNEPNPIQVWRFENKEDRHDAAVFQFWFPDRASYEEYQGGNIPTGKFAPKKTKNPKSDAMKTYLKGFMKYIQDKPVWLVIEEYMCTEEPPPGEEGSTYKH